MTRQITRKEWLNGRRVTLDQYNLNPTLPAVPMNYSQVSSHLDPSTGHYNVAGANGGSFFLKFQLSEWSTVST